VVVVIAIISCYARTYGNNAVYLSVPGAGGPRGLVCLSRVGLAVGAAGWRREDPITFSLCIYCFEALAVVRVERRAA